MSRYNWKSLTPNLKREFCSFSDCSKCSFLPLECSEWSETEECSSLAKGYGFLKKIARRLDNDVRIQLCELVDCSYKNYYSRSESSCAFYSGKDRDLDGRQYCSKWFSIPDLSLFDPIAKKITEKITETERRERVDIDSIDSMVREISSRWKIEVKS